MRVTIDLSPLDCTMDATAHFGRIIGNPLKLSSLADKFLVR
jgi:hypothetical protein